MLFLLHQVNYLYTNEQDEEAEGATNRKSKRKRRASGATKPQELVFGGKWEGDGALHRLEEMLQQAGNLPIAVEESQRLQEIYDESTTWKSRALKAIQISQGSASPMFSDRTGAVGQVEKLTFESLKGILSEGCSISVPHLDVLSQIHVRLALATKVSNEIDTAFSPRPPLATVDNILEHQIESMRETLANVERVVLGKR